MAIHNRRHWGRGLLAGLFLGPRAAGAGGVRHYHVKPKQLCGIPPANYQPLQPPPTVTPARALSEKADLVDPPAPATSEPAPITLQILGTSPELAPMAIQIPRTPPSRPRIKVFQFIPTGLRIDHCSISRMAATITDAGGWRLTLQADQNPGMQPTTAVRPALTVQGAGAVPIAPIRGLPPVEIKETNHLKRNLFVVRLRAYGAFNDPIAVTNPAPGLGRPVLFAPGPIEFWVQRGVPFPLTAEGVHCDVRSFFDLIDRVEIEFSYR